MQYFGIVFLIVLGAGQGLGRSFDKDIIDLSINAKSIESSLKDFLEVKLKELLRNGNETLGIPVLDPFNKDQMIFYVNRDGIIADIQLDFIDIEGISNYTVDTAKFAILTKKLTLALKFPKIYAKGMYEVEGTVLKNVDIFGNGKFDIIIKDFSIDVVAKFSITGGISVKSLDLKIDLRACDFNATGIYDDEITSEIFSDLISEIVPQIVTDYQNEITSVAESQLIEVVNTMLKGKTLQDLLAMLG